MPGVKTGISLTVKIHILLSFLKIILLRNHYSLNMRVKGWDENKDKYRAER